MPMAVLIDHVQAASAAKVIALSVAQCHLSLVALKDLERTGQLLLVAGSTVVFLAGSGIAVWAWRRSKGVSLAARVGGGHGLRGGARDGERSGRVGGPGDRARRDVRFST